jgi:8-oxo-dGTP pyrophosphatase MutT (NUDIX family)
MLDRVEIAVEPWRWEFAAARREEIVGHFAARQRERLALWNGRVLLLNHYSVENGALRGTGFETDYATFLAFRDWDFPDAGVFNFFAAAALRSADGAYLVGEMAQSTAGAGQLSFPCGTPDPDDLGAGGALDLAGNLARELSEETGLDIVSLTADPGWCLVRDRGFLALIKRLTAREDAQALRSRIMRYLEREAQPEFCDIRIVRGPADFDPRMVPSAVAFLERVWRQ